jgi:PAS domain S-box-containing protein
MAPLRLDTKLNLILALMLVVLFATAAFLTFKREQSLVERVGVDNARNIARQIVETRDYISSVVKGEPARNPDLIPQVVATRVAKRLTQGSSYVVRQVSLRYRNPENRPDDYEATQLRSFSQRQVKESFNTVTAGQEHSIRYMLPMIAEKSCLECHGSYESAPPFVQQRFPKGHPSYDYTVGEIIGAVSVTIPVAELYRETGANLRSDLLFWGVVLLGILLVTGAMVRRMIISPVSALADTITRVAASGNFDERLEPRSRDEIGRLTVAFNNLMEELKHRTTQSLESGQRYRNLVEITRSAIVTFLADGRIVSANHQAGLLFGMDSRQMLGESLFDFIAEERETLQQHLETALREGRCGGPEGGIPLTFRCRKGEKRQLEVALTASESEGRHLVTAILREPSGA